MRTKIFMFSAMFVVHLCVSAEGRYRIDRETKTWVHDDSKVEKRFHRTVGKMEFGITGDDVKSIDIAGADVDVQFDELHTHPHTASAFKRMNSIFADGDRGMVSFSAKDGITATIKDKAIKGKNWEVLEDEAISIMSKKAGVDSAHLISTFWFLRNVPLVFDIDQEITAGDSVDIPFRKKDSPNRTSSDSRASEAMCVDRQGDVVTLESNIEKSPHDGFLVAWHVRIEFDVSEQRLLNAEESRFVRVVMRDNGDVQTTREVVLLKLIDEELP